MQNSQKSKISGIESTSMIDTDNKNNEILDFIFLEFLFHKPLQRYSLLKVFLGISSTFQFSFLCTSGFPSTLKATACMTK